MTRSSATGNGNHAGGLDVPRNQVRNQLFPPCRVADIEKLTFHFF
jgi:hypothetical protein